ncbi:hypothetical protein LCGC14_2212440, partial [marine sediment metagenome]
LRRNDSFLSGRGVPNETRVILLIDSLIMPYLDHLKEYYGSENCYFEIGILSAALLNKFPKAQIESLDRKISYNDENLFANIFEMTTQFVKLHNASTNDTVVLPNMDTAQILYINSSRDLPLISTWKTKTASNDETVKSIKSLLKFFENSDKKIPLIYLRGELKGTDENIILVRNPRVEGKPLCLIKTGAEEINVTEMMTLLETRSHLDRNWINIENVTKGVYDIEIEEREEIEIREVEEKEEVQVEVFEESDKKSKGFFGKLKGIFGGSKPKTPIMRTETKIKKKKVKEKVKKKVEKKTKLAYHIPPYLSQAIGVHGLSDLRLYEIFDTIREAEYVVTGTLESNFAENKTTFLTSEDEEQINQLAETLDGLDSVIEKVIDFYFKSKPQILPTEILFLSKDDKRSLICLNGDKDRIVGTIAKNYEKKDITQWQQTGEDQETVQRRTLHMRTNQLLSARVHTPFDAATSRIYGTQIKSDAKFISLDHAILPLDNK